MTVKRDLSLADRKVNTKPSKKVVVFDIDDIDRHFRESIALIQKQLDCVDAITKLDAVVAEEIIRSQIVALDSAFDFYLHEIIKFGIVEMYHQEDGFPQTKSYKKLLVPMRVLEQAVIQSDKEDWLKEWINEAYSWKPYMSYESFKEVCHLIDIGVGSISEALYPRGNGIDPMQELKARIDNLYNHRNRIAHQSDRESEDATRCTITKEAVGDYICNIRRIVDEMSKQIREKQSDKGEPTSKE